VQASTKYGLAVNFKAAKALGLDVPPTLLARADDVIDRPLFAASAHDRLWHFSYIASWGRYVRSWPKLTKPKKGGFSL
jgi:hypothetical protein